MALHTDILDQPERLWRAFWGSIALHASLVAAVLAVTFVQSRHPRENWGDIHGGGMGSVAVNAVARIPLPTQGGAVNPVANDTQSRAPEPPARTKAQPQVKAPEPDAIPIQSRNAQRQPSAAASGLNKFRAQQKDLPNQVYSQSGQRLVSPMVGMSGGGGSMIGLNTPFGTQFGYYTDLIKNRVAQHWRTGDINPRIRTANPVVVTFTIDRDGSVQSQSVRVAQTSGIAELDLSARRAVLEAMPFPNLPPQSGRSSLDVEFYFELRR